MEPPPPGMIDEMRQAGELDRAIKFAERIGNHRMKVPALAAEEQGADPQTIADRISQSYGMTLDGREPSALGAQSPADLKWLKLDKNRDRVVDERDVLALGFPEPKVAATLPSLGTSETFCLIIEFPDYDNWFSKAEFESKLFGAGDTSYYYRGLKYYYGQASYSQLTIDGSVYGWYTAAHNRAWYHPNDNNDYPEDDLRREQLIFEAIDAADAAGEDFSQYDNDGDGYVDYFLVVWTGPHGNWATFWWGYQTSIYVLANKTVDGVRFGTYSWQWEQYYGFSQQPPNPSKWDPLVTIHETGHALGLPDYYDYDGSQGPDGGVGRLDMMDGNWGDHNSFSKYVLGWLTPTVAFTNFNDEQLSKSNANGDAVIFMPGFDPVMPWSEYFIAQNRYREGIDQTYPTDGLLLWHVDANVDKRGNALWDNSYTSHKLLRLMEADGLEEIETGDGNADAGDFYQSGEQLTPTSTPNSNKYDGSNPGINCTDISAAGQNMTADFTLYTSNPPTVSIDDPSPGTVSGDVPVTITATDDGTVDKVQLLIDGLIVKEWTSGPYEYSWNSRVDFNKSLNLVARAWDDELQVGSDTISVTVSNTGVTSVFDDFEGTTDNGLAKWRVINDANVSQGAYTHWNTRTSPGSPTPMGSGKEAYVKSSDITVTHTASDHLRSQRINATGFTRPVQVKFFYRTGDYYGNTGVLTLWATTDNGATWEKLDSLANNNNWSLYTRTFDYAGETVYFKLSYTGSFRENQNSGRSANIDNFYIRECPSNPPTASFTNPSDGSDVSGSQDFDVSASDDGTVAKVLFYLNGTLVSTDTSAPWRYTRNTLNDDNHPEIVVMAYAIDNDDIASDHAEITVAFKNARPFPASDDLEGGTGEWSVTNDGQQPEWIYSTTQSNSASHSYGWEGSGWQTYNWDQLVYKGETPSSGYQTIDLSGSGVSSPVLKYYLKADFPSNGYIRIYFYSTWLGWTTIDIVSADSASWTQKSVPLDQFIGHSGRIVFYAANSNAINGTGVWIDDISVDNGAPFITSVTPNRAKVGDEITIAGSAFGSTQSGGEVRFNDGSGGYVSQSTVTSWSNTEIVCDVPAGAKSHATDGVWVHKGSDDSNKKQFTVILPSPNLGGLDQL